MDGPSSRRAFLTAGLMTLGVAALKFSPVKADTGDAMTLGTANTAQNTTDLTVTDVASGLRVNADDGQAVAGFAKNGVGGIFSALPDGSAIWASGRLTLQQSSGLAIVLKGHQSVTVTPDVPLIKETMILAVANGGSIPVASVALHRKAIPQTFTIQLTAPAQINVPVAWLQLDRVIED